MLAERATKGVSSQTKSSWAWCCLMFIDRSCVVESGRVIVLGPAIPNASCKPADNCPVRIAPIPSETRSKELIVAYNIATVKVDGIRNNFELHTGITRKVIVTKWTSAD